MHGGGGAFPFIFVLVVVFHINAELLSHVARNYFRNVNLVLLYVILLSSLSDAQVLYGHSWSVCTQNER